MNNTSSNRIATIFKSRTTIVTLLNDQGYDMSNYDSISINEIDAMTNNQQLDIYTSANNVSMMYMTAANPTMKLNIVYIRPLV